MFLTSFIGYFLTQVVLENSFSDKALYHGAEYRFANVAGVRSSDFIVKRPSQQFLIAPSAPKELKAQIELSSAGRYIAVVEAEYPDWLCKPAHINKASVLIRGGSLNQYVKLIQKKPQEVGFTAAKGQRLSLQLINATNKECGRALLTLYKVVDTTSVKIGLLVLWACIMALCFFSLSSFYLVTIGLLTNTLLIAAQASLGALTTASIMVNTGLALGFTGVLFFLAAIPLKSRLIALISMIAMALLLSPALSFIAYEQVFSAPFSIEAVHGAMQSYGAQALEFWREFVGKKRTLFLGLALFLLYLGLRQVNQARAIIPKALIFGISLILASGALTLGRLENSGIYNLLLESVIVYRWEIDAFEKVASQRKSFTAQATRSPEHSQDTTVVVFGESVNKKQMSAYGYVRATTPLLDKRISNGEVVLFSNAYSNHTHSNPTMSMMLTQADQYSDKPWQESPSIFNYARAANVETQWLTNHRLLGGWSNNITTIIREACSGQVVVDTFNSDNSNFIGDRSSLAECNLSML